ncbi:peptidyl-prolyl cis-trans isomerase B (cyclophilin B) [Acholeplasma morum]|uniref:peptidylprolyl isomerase n=1 Tax=Paracholeplasma morum TaxID=264637 RepID=UPI00195DD091|nr:peptidylprolyl isomerase [Paracholeplasma morum]MBM7453605.1 peptidyl-prolyl cis-trans isomerase B (cyclophilin B) [Paracholeplasma morum]
MYQNESNPIVTLKIKDKGEIKIELFVDVAPNTAYNFIDLVSKNYYAGLIFHRIIPGFMIQGGQGMPSKPIKGDFKSNGVANPILHERGVISMARTSDPNSATTQFFIMHKNSPHLDGQYAAFGMTISGFDVIDAIATTRRDFSDRPIEPIIIESCSIDLKGKSYPKPVYLY